MAQSHSIRYSTHAWVKKWLLTLVEYVYELSFHPFQEDNSSQPLDVHPSKMFLHYSTFERRELSKKLSVDKTSTWSTFHAARILINEKCKCRTTEYRISQMNHVFIFFQLLIKIIKILIENQAFVVYVYATIFSSKVEFIGSNNHNIIRSL